VLGLVWLVLCGVKLASPTTFQRYLAGDVGFGLQVGVALAWIVILLEGLLGCVLVTPGCRGKRAATLLSTLFAFVVLLYVCAFSGTSEVCGCFGTAIQASRARRLIVAGAILFLSASEWRCAHQSREPHS
jgi:uncharacterized membrane protein YphA (DoxX/SURF4 family)